MTDTTPSMNWDLTSYFPVFNGPEMQAFKEELLRDIESIRDRAMALTPLDEDNQADWEAIYLQYEGFIARIRHIYSYVSCLTSADARNEAYATEQAALSPR